MKKEISRWRSFFIQMGCMIFVVGSVYFAVLFPRYISRQEPPIEVDSVQAESSEDGSLALYQRYYALQSKLDTLSEEGTDYRVSLLRLEEKIKGQLSSDSSDIELHRSLIRTQNERHRSRGESIEVEGSVKDQMDDIRQELEDRGEPPPG